MALFFKKIIKCSLNLVFIVMFSIFVLLIIDKFSFNHEEFRILSKLKPGMDSKNIFSIIGEPIYFKRNNKVKTKPDMSNVWIWIYSKPKFFFGGYEVYLIVDNFVLMSVHAEYFDTTIYYCDEDKCPGLIDK